MKYLRLSLCLILIFVCSYSFLYGYKKIDEDKIIKQQQDYKGIISLWQIDTFEGGKGSRKQFLLKIAREFEKQNVGVLAMVSDMSIEGAKEKIERGEYPDMISYGLGLNLDSIEELSLDNTVKGGIIKNKTYATAWCRGGYFLFRNKIKSKKAGYYNTITVFKNDNVCPLASLVLSGKSFDKVIQKSPLESYYSFVNYECEYMLGTQRDIERLSKRDFSYDILPLNEYNDLFQYISICTKDTKKYGYSQEFINLLVSEKSQRKLKDISMFSPFYKVPFDNENMLNNQYFGEYSTISAFLEKDKKLEIDILCNSFLTGEKSIQGKIKNLLI